MEEKYVEALKTIKGYIDTFINKCLAKAKEDGEVTTEEEEKDFIEELSEFKNELGFQHDETIVDYLKLGEMNGNSLEKQLLTYKITFDHMIREMGIY